MSKNSLGKVYVVGASSFLGSSFYNFLKKKNICVTGTYYSKNISNLEYFDLSEKKFFQIIDKHVNKKLFVKKNNKWKSSFLVH